MADQILNSAVHSRQGSEILRDDSTSYIGVWLFARLKNSLGNEINRVKNALSSEVDYMLPSLLRSAFKIGSRTRSSTSTMQSFLQSLNCQPPHHALYLHLRLLDQPGVFH